MEHYLKAALVTIIIMAVVARVPALNQLVTGQGA